MVDIGLIAYVYIYCRVLEGGHKCIFAVFFERGHSVFSSRVLEGGHKCIFAVFLKAATVYFLAVVLKAGTSLFLPCF